jgi:hypothetical protein
VTDAVTASAARTKGSAVKVGDNARRGLVGVQRLGVDAAGYGLGLALAALAAVRRGKAVHPHGAVYEAELVVPAGTDWLSGTTLFGSPGRYAAVMRFSRSLGLPRPLPDLLGVSVRVLDAYGQGRHQDLLVVTSVDAPVAHHFFVPASDVQQRPYSSSLPYRTGERRLLIGVLPRPDTPRPEGGNELERLEAAASTGALVFDLAVAEMWGRFRPIAELRVGHPLPPAADALRFNPWNCGGGLEPAGFLNRLRDHAYPLSQRAWAARGHAAHQEAAESAVAQVHR